MGELLQGRKHVDSNFRVEDCSTCVIRLTKTFPECKPILHLGTSYSVVQRKGALQWCRGETKIPTSAPTTLVVAAEATIVSTLDGRSGDKGLSESKNLVANAMKDAFKQMLGTIPTPSPTTIAPTTFPTQSYAKKRQMAEKVLEEAEGHRWLTRIAAEVLRRRQHQTMEAEVQLVVEAEEQQRKEAEEQAKKEAVEQAKKEHQNKEASSAFGQPRVVSMMKRGP
jgi:hypothetical protein